MLCFVDSLHLDAFMVVQTGTVADANEMLPRFFELLLAQNRLDFGFSFNSDLLFLRAEEGGDDAREF